MKIKLGPQKADFDRHYKLKELVLYIAAKCANNPKFGRTKLNKILFYSDFEAYFRLGKSITEEEYFKLPWGPAPRRLKLVLEEMEDADEITEIIVPYLAGDQHRVAAKRKPKLKQFTADEIAIVDEIIQTLWDKDAEEVSELSHRFIGWKIAQNRDTIPYETAFIVHPNDVVITDLSIKKAKKIASRR